MLEKHERSGGAPRLSWESLYELVDRAPFGVVIIDADFRIALINAASQEHAFRNVRPAVGRDLGEAMRILWSEDVAASMISEFRRALETGKPYFSRDFMHPRADSDRVEAHEWELHRIQLPDGRSGVVFYDHDSTHWRTTERDLRRSEAWLRGQKEALEASVNGATLETALGVLVRSALEHLGGDARAAFYCVTPDGAALNHVVGMGEAYARAVADFPVGPDSIACGLAAQTGKPVVYTDVLLEPTWEPFLPLAREFDYRACWCFPLQTPGGKVVGTFAVYSRRPREMKPQDMEVAAALTQAAAIIMARHQAAQERAQAERTLREDNRRKDEFLAMLAHELRNPLAAIRSGSQVLLHADDANAVHSAAQILDRQVEHMVRQVDDLLDASRINRNRIELRKAHVELAPIALDAVEANRPLLEALGHELTVTLPSDPILVDGDPVRLAQVVGNLLNNACKFTEQGGRIGISVESEDSQAVIRVRDTGIGIAPADLARIFEMFAQVERPLERARDGLGVGLALVRNLVEMHGGSVEARSDGVGRGAEFVVRLPVLTGARPLRSRGLPGVSTAAAAPRRVLVVDDNRDSADVLAMLLRHMGHEVETAYDGNEALERAATFEADFILLDIGMPALNGYDAARTLRAHRPQGLTLVAVTGWGQDEDRRRSREAGFDAHLIKPVDLHALTQLLS